MEAVHSKGIEGTRSLFKCQKAFFFIFSWMKTLWKLILSLFFISVCNLKVFWCILWGKVQFRERSKCSKCSLTIPLSARLFSLSVFLCPFRSRKICTINRSRLEAELWCLGEIRKDDLWWLISPNSTTNQNRSTANTYRISFIFCTGSQKCILNLEIWFSLRLSFIFLA